MEHLKHMPSQIDLMWPTLQALEGLGRSASIRELNDQVLEIMNLSDEILDVLHKDGPKTEFTYRCGWARTRLSKLGAVVNSSRGVWTITEIGRQYESEDELRLLEQKRQKERRIGQPESSINEVNSEDSAAESEEDSLDESLIRILLEMKPDAFERLCQRLLRELEFDRVEVTGRSNDHGIDGKAVLRLNLMSFHVYYQCKRHSSAVGPGYIRDFRGAIVSRADKGLFITTSFFTSEARREAIEVLPAIDLIDGTELCKLLRENRLGVGLKVDPDFFDKI